MVHLLHIGKEFIHHFLKMFNIQFDFDPDTSEITNLKVVKINTQPEDALVYIRDNKLSLSKEACSLIGAKANDRICIQYFTVNPEETFPVIGTPEMFGISEGNRLTKSNTVSYRGSQKEILEQYGRIFKLEPFKDYFKMVAVNISENDNLSEEESDLENLKEDALI